MNPEEILRQVAEETMEALAYLLPMSEEDVELDGQLIGASVLFNGPFNGALVMKITQTMLDELAANMLGQMDSELTEAQQLDGFKELLNVVCGNLLPQLAGDQAVFNVAAPLLLEDIDAEHTFESLEKICAITMELDVGNAELQLFLDESARAAIS